MADTMSEGAPLPPKRPTIIRPSLTPTDPDDSPPARPVPPRPAPSRPAPPPPGGGRQPPGIPDRPQKSLNGEARRPPPSAARIPPRPKVDTAKNSKTPGKKRPEITIVCAKPMNEVGFRGGKIPSLDPPEKKADPPSVPTKPAASENSAPSRPRPPSMQPRPPPPNRSSNGQADLINLMDDDVGQSTLPPPIPLTQPPPSSNLLDLDPDPTPQTIPPVIPMSRPPPPIPSSRPVSHPVSRPVPPPPRPTYSAVPHLPSRHPQTRDEERPPTPPVRGSSIERNDNETRSSPSPPPVAPRGAPPIPASRPVAASPPSEEKKIPPTRPTVIRPGRPQASERPATSSEKPVVPHRSPVEDTKKQSVIQDKSNNASAEPVYMKINKKSDTGANENNEHALPFKVKLKPTVSPREDDSDPPPVPLKQYEEKESPPLTKTKPTILMRPKPSPDKEESENNDEPDSTETKPVIKRPTIIRPPPKPKRLLESEEDQDTKKGHEDDKSEVKPLPPVPAKRPDSITTLDPAQKDTKDIGSTSPKPIPARRPVSVAARFEQHVQENQSGQSRPPPPPKKSPVSKLPDESPQEPSKLIPPKPKARTRATPVDSPPELPAVSDIPPQTNESPEDKPVLRQGPPRPAGRPRSMVLQRSPESDKEGADKVPPPRPSGRPMSMMIPKKMEDKESDNEPNKIPPPRPSGQPVSMLLKSPEEAESKPKPARPSGGPSVRRTSEDTDEDKSSSITPPHPADRPMSMVAPRRKSEEEAEEEVKARPARPTGPPPEHSPTHQEEKVEKRPPRPQAGPPRPMSVPVKPPSPAGSRGASRSRPMKTSPRTGAKTPELPPRPGPDHDLYHYVLTVPHAIAKHDYTASQADELSFKAEDIVVLVSRLDADWLIGKVGTNEGMFPAGFVDIIHPLHDEIPDLVMKQPEMPSWDSPTLSKKPKPELTSGPRCVARFDYEGEGQDDLTFEEDDHIKLIGRVGTEWLRGEFEGKVGIFPISFVEVVEDLPPETEEKSAERCVTAMFDFDGHDDELSLQAGQKVTILSQINTEWLYGETEAGKSGKFPSAFVDHIPTGLPLLEPANQQAGSASLDQSASPKGSVVSVNQSKPHCVALYDFESQQEDDLSFKEGEIIQLLEKVGSDWLRGSCNGRQGMFPAGFVKIEQDFPDVTDSAPAPKEEVKALYDFEGENDNELSFKEGEIIELAQKQTGSSDWMTGTINGRSGIFPAAFVEKIN